MKGFSMVRKPDIIYFVKPSMANNELTYSLRTLENFKVGGRVWFYGFCPYHLAPDYFVECNQGLFSKWKRVHDMIVKVCENDNITEDFWLFNDDFFVLNPVEKYSNEYNGTLQELADSIHRRVGIETKYTINIRCLAKFLEKEGLPTKNYCLHKPMLVNRKKALEVLKKYPDEPMFRSLYGNYWNIGRAESEDCKISKHHSKKFDKNWQFVSTDDATFREGDVGRYIREKFDKPSKYEL